MKVWKKMLTFSLVGLMSLSLISCGKDEGQSEEDVVASSVQKIEGFDTISSVDSLVCCIPSTYRQNAISDKEYWAQGTVTPGTAIVETKRLDSYQLTDYSTFLFNFYRDAVFENDLFYVNSEDDLMNIYAGTSELQNFAATGNFIKVEQNGLIKVCSDVTFSAALNETVTEPLKGKMVLIQYDGECYAGIFAIKEDGYDEDTVFTMADTFNYSGTASDLLGTSAVRTDLLFTDASGLQEIALKPCELWEQQEDGTLLCSAYGATAKIVLMDSSVDRVLTSDEIYESFSPEGAYDNVKLVWTTSATGADGQEWVSKSYDIESENSYCNTFFATSKDRTVCFVECTFENTNNRYMIELLLKDLCENAVIQKNIAIGDNVVTPAPEPEVTEEVVVDETEAPATEAPVTETPVTEAPVTEEPTTAEPVTEAPVTEAPVTEAPVVTPAPQAPVQKPSTPKKNTNKNNNKNNLDVEW